MVQMPVLTKGQDQHFQRLPVLILHEQQPVALIFPKDIALETPGSLNNTVERLGLFPVLARILSVVNPETATSMPIVAAAPASPVEYRGGVSTASGVDSREQPTRPQTTMADDKLSKD